MVLQRGARTRAGRVHTRVDAEISLPGTVLRPYEFAPPSPSVPRRPLAVCDLAPPPAACRERSTPRRTNSRRGRPSGGWTAAWTRLRPAPGFRRLEAIAEVVTGPLFRGVELGHYQLGAFVLMANHVHALLRPRILPSQLRKSLKGYTAREANRLLGRTGEPFWQRSGPSGDESPGISKTTR